MKKNVIILFCAIGLIIGCFVGAFYQGKKEFESNSGLSLNPENIASYVVQKASPNYEENTKLASAKLISGMLDLSYAAQIYKENNGVNDDDGVFIPSIIEQDGHLYGEALNTCLFKINTSIEDYISNYNL